jgi:hypothetical protein
MQEEEAPLFDHFPGHGARNSVELIYLKENQEKKTSQCW